MILLKWKDRLAKRQAFLQGVFFWKLKMNAFKESICNYLGI
jgi:hypothetical protein